MADTRREKDPLGSLDVPMDAQYGVQTLRAKQNFPLSGLRPLDAFVDAQVWIKKAAALTHKETGRLDAKLADAIVRAANEMLGGKRGAYAPVHPNDHVNMAQSTNDTIPTNIRLACLSQLVGFNKAFENLRAALAAKGVEFDDIVKAGRKI